MENERHLFEEERGKIERRGGGVPAEIVGPFSLGLEKHPEGQETKQRAALVGQRRDPRDDLDVKRIQRPERGTGERREIAPEQLRADAIDNPGGERVDREEQHVVGKGLKTADSADEPVGENRERPVESALRTLSLKENNDPRKIFFQKWGFLM